jgi:hypothetical protein
MATKQIAEARIFDRVKSDHWLSHSHAAGKAIYPGYGQSPRKLPNPKRFRNLQCPRRIQQESQTQAASGGWSGIAGKARTSRIPRLAEIDAFETLVSRQDA